MYLSRLILNPRSRRVQRELAQPYEMHRSVMRGFPKELQPGIERVLWRVEEHPQLGFTLLVQSSAEPDWRPLADAAGIDYLLPVAGNPAVKPFELALGVGQILAFRLRANPTKRLNLGKERPGKRVGIYDKDDQATWLERKAEQNGFTVLEARIRPEGKFTDADAIHRADQTHKLELLSVRFDGMLRVIDPARLTTAVETGIGSGKGFGFGLLSLAPAR